jgi:hypothetical protein
MVRSSLIPDVASKLVVDAKKSVKIVVKDAHKKAAKRCKGKECVVAKAFDDSNIGEYYEGVEVGLTVTKITCNGKIVRYATPLSLKPIITEYDKTGVWNFPQGEQEYEFKVLSPSQRLGARESRWDRHQENTDGSGRDKMKPRATPSRTISRSSNKKAA